MVNKYTNMSSINQIHICLIKMRIRYIKGAIESTLTGLYKRPEFQKGDMDVTKFLKDNNTEKYTKINKLKRKIIEIKNSEKVGG